MGDNEYNIINPCVLIDGDGSVQRSLDTAQDIAQSISKNISTIVPEHNKKSISIDQIRELRKKIILKSKDNNQVFIINHIELLGNEAQNALLKTLEELQNTTIILLVAGKKEDALKTIQSRAQILYARGDSEDLTPSLELIRSTLAGHSTNVSITVDGVKKAAEFIRLSVADRLNTFKKYGEDREKVLELLESLRVVVIASMRNAKSDKDKLSWSHKVTIANDLIEKYHAQVSSKLLLLGAATRL